MLKWLGWWVVNRFSYTLWKFRLLLCYGLYSANVHENTNRSYFDLTIPLEWIYLLESTKQNTKTNLGITIPTFKKKFLFAWKFFPPPHFQSVCVWSGSLVQFSSVTQSCSTLCDPMDCSTPGHPVHPGVYPNSCPLSRWCHPAISSSVIPSSSHLHSFPASGSFQMSQLFTSGGQSIGVSASTSVLPMNTQDWFPLGWTGWIWQSKGLSRVLNTTVQKHQIFGTQLSL